MNTLFTDEWYSAEKMQERGVRRRDEVNSNLKQSDFLMFSEENKRLMEELNIKCQDSKIGEYKCCVETRYGWCCDMCLENELLWLYRNGVHTVNSCCGHGNIDLASILVIGENSIAMMNELGYEESPTAIPMTMQPLRSYIPKTPLPYM